MYKTFNAISCLGRVVCNLSKHVIPVLFLNNHWRPFSSCWLRRSEGELWGLRHLVSPSRLCHWGSMSEPPCGELDEWPFSPRTACSQNLSKHIGEELIGDKITLSQESCLKKIWGFFGFEDHKPRQTSVGTQYDIAVSAVSPSKMGLFSFFLFF